MITVILGISIALQFTAAFLFLRLIKITGNWQTWSLFAATMIFMGIRRLTALVQIISGDVARPLDLTAELIALVISCMLLAGVISIAPVIKRIRAESRDLVFKQFSTDQANDAIYWVNSAREIIDLNETACHMLGYTREEILDMNIDEIDPEIQTYDWENLWQEVNQRDNYTYESKHVTHEGKVFPVDVKLNSFTIDGGQHICFTVKDITGRKDTEMMLSFHTTHDNLTGLINRKEFERRVQILVDRNQTEKFEHALCYMDLDLFKVINDTCGHAAGDELLRQVSKILKNIVRRGDTLARLGGDEFAVLMEYCTIEDAHRLARAILKSVDDFQFDWNGETYSIAVSIGLTHITESTNNLADLLKQADMACYMAKEKGRNRIHVYQKNDQDISLRHDEMQWVNRINRALEKNSFGMYAQSIISLDGDTDLHYELLVRLIDENGKVIPPGYFLPAAERYNLIQDIDRWVIEYVFKKLAINPALLEKISFLSINLSGQSLVNEKFMNFIIDQLRVNNIEGKKICFEITETSVISNMEEAIRFITTLRSHGCQFALDDFGSGLSSLRYLKTLPVNYLKIDGIFVKDIVNDPVDHVMVKSINDIGKVIGTKTIAEYVENDEIKGMLKEIGVNYAQGYGIGLPQKLDNILYAKSTVPTKKVVTL